MLAMIGFALISMPELFVSLDLNVSSFCIILLYKWNDGIAARIFCCCLLSPKEMRARSRTISTIQPVRDDSKEKDADEEDMKLSNNWNNNWNKVCQIVYEDSVFCVFRSSLLVSYKKAVHSLWYCKITEDNDATDIGVVFTCLEKLTLRKCCALKLVNLTCSAKICLSQCQ